MPNITTNTELPTYFPNKFIYPFGNDSLIPIYSSIPIPNIQTSFPAKVNGDLATRQEVLIQPTLQK